MSRIFDVNNLKFGDKLRTRDGKMAIFLKKEAYSGNILVAIQHMPNNCYHEHYKIKDSTTLIESYYWNRDLDIIGYWED